MSASRHAVSAVVGLERGATALLLHQEEKAAFIFVLYFNGFLMIFKMN